MSNEDSEDSGLNVYLIFVAGNPVQSILSTEDLVERYLSEVRRLAANKKWDEPITFVDANGVTISAYMPHAILGVVRGVRATPEMLQKLSEDSQKERK